MHLPRIYDDINQYVKSEKVLIVFGPRQVGKTTLIEYFLSRSSYRSRLETGDNIRIQNLLSVPDLPLLQNFCEGYELIVIDEAQKINNIGETLKLIIDQIPNLRIIVTGSSSFELSGQVGEPLTGRKTTLTLFPLSQLELKKIYNPYDLQQQLETFLIYGSYPEIITSTSLKEKREQIVEIMESYLLKDIFALERVKNSKVILDLLRLLAFQLGNEVALSELAKNLGVDAKTVGRYLDLLEKSFVIYNLRGYSKNLRKEITKKSKYYFYDTGIRNAIVANFNSLAERNDVGALWENFVIIERIKKQNYERIYSNNYFWRTWDQQEIDWIEERDGQLFAYEIKWKEKKAQAPKAWRENYPNAQFTVIHPGNYLEFVG